MRYRKRNEDGTLGDLVYTPAGEEERLKQGDADLVDAYEAIAMQQEMIQSQTEAIATLQAEVQVLKGEVK